MDGALVGNLPKVAGADTGEVGLFEMLVTAARNF